MRKHSHFGYGRKVTDDLIEKPNHTKETSLSKSRDRVTEQKKLEYRSISELRGVT